MINSMIQNPKDIALLNPFEIHSFKGKSTYSMFLKDGENVSSNTYGMAMLMAGARRNHKKHNRSKKRR